MPQNLIPNLDDQPTFRSSTVFNLFGGAEPPQNIPETRGTQVH